MKISYGLQNPEGMNKKPNLLSLFSKKTKSLGLSNESKDFIIKECLKYADNSHEILAYRMAFGLPTRITKEEHEFLFPKPRLIID